MNLRERCRDAAGANGVKGGVEAMQNGYWLPLELWLD
jgi:hypothetical protein